MTREADNPMTGSDFDWMVSNHAVWGWKAPVKASVSGVSLLQLFPFPLSSFPFSPETPDTQVKKLRDRMTYKITMVNNLRFFFLWPVLVTWWTWWLFLFIADLAVNFCTFQLPLKSYVKFIFCLLGKGSFWELLSLSIKIAMLSYSEQSQRRSFKLNPSHIIIVSFRTC